VYFDYQEGTALNTWNILTNPLLHLLQCLGTNPWPKTLFDKLQISSSKPRSRLDIASLLQLMRLCTQQFEKIFFIFDSLDELENHADRTQLLEFLDETLKWNREIKILLTSQPHISLDKLEISAQILEISPHIADLTTYIREKIKHRKFGPHFENEIVAKTLAGADGMYSTPTPRY
jgi:hypothetical protein